MKLQIRKVWIEERADELASTAFPSRDAIGIIAKAEIWNPDTQTVQTIHSGGLWGIESDSGDYLGEVALDELAGLCRELEALGFGGRAIAFAFSKVDKELVAR